MVLRRWERTESWRKVNLSSDLGQPLRRCPRLQVALHPSMLQVLFTGRPHLARLSGVARVLVPALTAKAITPRGTLKMVAFQLMSCPSSSKSRPEHLPLEGDGLCYLRAVLGIDEHTN